RRGTKPRARYGIAAAEAMISSPVDLFLRLGRLRLRFVEAPLGDNAVIALGHARLADIAPMQDQPVMGVEQIFFRYDLEESLFNLDRRLAGGQARPVGDTVQMRVDGDRRLAVNDIQHDIGGLAADAGQGLQRLARLRYPRIELFDQQLRQRKDVLRLAAVKSDGLDMALDALHPERDHFLRCVGRLEEAGRRLVDAG